MAGRLKDAREEKAKGLHGKEKTKFDCNHKVAFPAEWRAQDRADWFFQKTKQRMRPYECPHCNKWHLCKDISEKTRRKRKRKNGNG